MQVENIKLYPNPATTIVNVDISQVNGITGFSLYNVIGELIKSGKVNSSDTSVVLHMEEMNSGVYYIMLNNASGEKIVKKFIKN